MTSLKTVLYCSCYKNPKANRSMRKEITMKQIYTSIDQLPIVLTADQLAQALGISRAGAYQLMHSKGFPTIRIGKRMVVPKEQLLVWMEEKLKEGNSLF